MYFCLKYGGKTLSRPNSYYGLMWSLLQSNEVRCHLMRTQAITRPLSLECGHLAKITTRSGTLYSAERWSGRVTKECLKSICQVVESERSLTQAGVTCIPESASVGAFSPEDGVRLPDAQLEMDVMFDSRNAIFDETGQPLLASIVSIAALRTKACHTGGLWKFAALLETDTSKAQVAARELIQFWRAVVSLEQSRHQPQYKAMEVDIRCLTKNVLFRTMSLRLEQWAGLFDLWERQEASAQNARRQGGHQEAWPRCSAFQAALLR